MKETTDINAVFPKVKKENRGINSVKLDKILKALLKDMPPSKRSFWENLPRSQEKDLVSADTTE